MKLKSHIFTTKVLAYCGVMIISGAISMSAFQLQKYYGFKHSIGMGQEMFIGEILALFSLVVPMIWNKKREQGYFTHFKSEHRILKEETAPGILVIGLGGALDSLASCLEVLAILIFPSTYYVLMKNGSILFTAIFSIVFLKKELYRHHWLGILIIFLGFSIITLSNFLNGNNDSGGKDSKSTVLGLSLMLLSLIFSSFQFVYQEYLFRKYAVDPKRLVGSEGIVGCLILTAVLAGTSFITCRNKDMCDEGMPFDSPAQAILFIAANFRVLVAGLIAILGVMIFNVSGVTLTKMVSAIFRRMIDSFRTILIWIISWMLGLDEINLRSFATEMIGLALLLVGNMVFTEIIEVNILGFNRFVSQRSMTDLA